MNCMAVKHIFFDFDGTLADSFDYVLDIYNNIAKKWKLQRVDENKARSLRGMTISDIRKELNLSAIPMLWVLINGFRKFTLDVRTLKLFPGIIDLMESLEKHGYELAVITSNSRRNVIKVFSKHKLEVIKHIYGGSIWRDKKRAIITALKDFNIKPEEAIYVGDEVRDIVAAKSAGLKVISVTWGYNSRNFLVSHQPDFIADSVEELRKIVSIKFN